MVKTLGGGRSMQGAVLMHDTGVVVEGTQMGSHRHKFICDHAVIVVYHN